MRRDLEIHPFALSWPLALLLSAQLGCGRAVTRTTPGGEPEPSAMSPGVIEPVGMAPEVMAPNGTAPDSTGSGGADPGVPQPSELPESPLERQLNAIVERECRSCHDGSLNDVAGPLSLEDLISNGWVRVGSGETSPLVVRLQFGDNRPVHRGVDVSDAELAELIRGINQHEPESREACGPFAPLSRDDVFSILLGDINARPAEERRFTRYVGLTYATNTGLCGSRFGQHEDAIIEMLNAISTRPEVVKPRRVDELDSAIYAIDLRDYGYDRPIDLRDDGNLDFDDAWLAFVAEMGPYGLALGGAEADELVRQTQTAVPFVSANALIQVATYGDLYAALVGVRRNLSDTAAALGVDASAGAAGLYRAGTFGSAEHPDRLVTRRAQTAHPGRAYWTLEEGEPAGVGATSGLREDPLDFQGAGSQVIFNLPNGIFAFALAGTDGVPSHELPKCFGCQLLRAESPVTCRGCHLIGLHAPPDEVLEFARANPDRYDQETLALISEQYRPAPELAAVIEADTLLNASARRVLGLSDSHIAAVFYEFRSHPLTPVSAAAELGVSVAELREALLRLETAPGTPLDPAVISSLRELMLDGGRVERGVFTAGFASLACAVPTGRNRPINCP